MVGVPRLKEPGCHTCRKRRVKCDKAKPDCQRCTRGGRFCEGYTRTAVFLNRTIDVRLHKRDYFDEVRPRAAPVKVHPASESGIVSVPRSICSTQAFYACLKGHLMRCWLPNGDARTAPVGEWLVEACSLHDSNELLDVSLAALSFAVIGAQTGDPVMLDRGQYLYLGAVRELQAALLDPYAVYDDRTLAACQALKIYDISRGAYGPADISDAHLQGAITLLLHRGSSRNSSMLSQAVSREIRYSAMATGLQHRTANDLGSVDWRTESWSRLHDVENSLLDLGLDLAALCEELKRLEGNNTAARPLMAVKSLKQILKYIQTLQEWHVSAVARGFLTAKWPELSESLHKISTFDPYLLHQSLLMLDYWAFLVIASEIMCNLVSLFPENVSLPKEVHKYGRDYQKYLVQNILATVRYASRETHGYMASSRCTLPARVILVPLRNEHFKGHVELRNSAEAFMLHLSKDRGIGYAGRLKQVSINWEK